MLHRKQQIGFTLIELMVAVSIFAIVALAVTQAFLTASRVNQKAQAMKTAIDNLHFALHNISYYLKYGSAYHCITGTLSETNPGDPVVYRDPQNCTGGTAIALDALKSGLIGNTNTRRMIFRLKEVVVNGATKGSIEYSVQTPGTSSMSDFTPITVDTLDIDTLSFSVYNASTGLGTEAPRVFITVAGTATLGRETAPFRLQTVVSERPSV